MEYPNAAYIATDFHCERSLNSWTDPFLLNNGWLVGLSDLDTESDYVRDRIAAYMTDLLGIGFSGFRMDAAKHIYPDSISHIFKIFKDNMGAGDLPDDFITYLEVILGGEMQMLTCNDSTYKLRSQGLGPQLFCSWNMGLPYESIEKLFLVHSNFIPLFCFALGRNLSCAILIFLFHF